MLAELRFAFRQLVKSSGFASVAVLTLALGLGANLAIFSVVEANLVHPLAFPDSDRLVRLWANDRAGNFNGPFVSWPKFTWLRERAAAFANLAATRPSSLVYGEATAPERIEGLSVTADFFPMLGVALQSGRNFAPGEDIPRGPRVVIVSDGFWRNRLGARPGVVGSTVRLDGDSYNIIGILPRDFGYPYADRELFVLDVSAGTDATPQQVQLGASFLNVTGRLRPGVSLEQAAAELTALNAAYAREFPGNTDAKLDLRARSYTGELIGSLRPALLLLLAAVGLVLLIASANVANLFLGRLSRRQREIAVRLSLGASRWHLVRQFLAESLVFTAVAAAVALPLGAVAQFAIDRIALGQLPQGAGFAFDPAALGYTLGLTLLTALLVGLFPAWQISRAQLAEATRDGSRGNSASRGGALRSGLIAGEVALSLLLLTTAALFYLSFERLQRVPAGFNPDGVASALVVVPVDRYATRPEQGEFIERILDRLRANPQLSHVGATLGLPLTGVAPVVAYAAPGQPVPTPAAAPFAGFRLATPDFFNAMGMTLRAGRSFSDRDRGDSSRVAILNESFARRLFPRGSALGQALVTGRMLDQRVEIVGIVNNVRTLDLAVAPPDEIYFPVRQRGGQYINLVVRTSGDPAALRSILRDAVAAEHPGLPISWFQTMRQIRAQFLARQNLLASLASAFAGLALVLTVVGLYSVLSYIVTLRTHEIGIRMALGARPARVVGLVMGQGARLVALGLVIGLAASVGLAWLIRSLLFATEPLDPLVYAAVTALFLLVGAFACLIPAARAAHVDPMIALRAE